MIYKGSCHCKAVTFEVEAADHLEVENCNCSICSKAGFLHLIVPLNQFKLIGGEENLTTYTFNTGIAKHTFCRVCGIKHNNFQIQYLAHTFCRVCGIKPFYIPRSNPDGIDVNVRCLDTQPLSLKIIEFDGQNWEQNAHKIAHKSLNTGRLA